jgi:hypothetical protein
MKIIKDAKYKSITSKAKKVGQVLDNTNPTEEDIHDAVVDLVSIMEYVVKKKLFLKNKVLIYELNSIEPNDIKHILKGTIKDRNTVGAFEAFNRYKLFYPKSKLVKQTKGIEILIRNRNELVHGLTLKEIQKKEDLIAFLSVVFPAFITDSKPILGALSIPKVNKEKTYTEKDIQKVYEDILLSKINNYNEYTSTASISNDSILINPNFNPPQPTVTTIFNPSFVPSSENYIIGNFGKEKCPRCTAQAMSRTNNGLSFSFFHTKSQDLYICSKCNLELTPTEYEMVKKLQKEGKIQERISFY